MGDRLRIGFVSITLNVAGTLVNRYKYLDIRTEYGDWDPLRNNILWPATLFEAAATTQKITEIDLGSASVQVPQSQLRDTLASVQNRVPGDAAQIRWSINRSTIAGVAAATYNLAAAAIVEGAGQFLAVYAEFDGDGTQAGSILADFDLPVLM